MAALQGRGAVFAVKGIYPYSSDDKEDATLLSLQSGSFRDLDPFPYNRTQLGALTAGTKVGSSMQIRGGVV